MQVNIKLKLVIAVLIAVVVAVLFYVFDLGSYLTLESIQSRSDTFRDFVQSNYVLGVLGFILIYIIFASLGLPGASLLTLLAGFLFGLWGVLYVNIAATVGATVLFLLSRFFIGDWVQSRFAKQLTKINSEITENGAKYLLSVRLTPIFPFWLINLLSGVTKLKIKDFIWPTALGTLPGTIAYVYAGRTLQEVESLSDILSPNLIIVLVLFSVLGLIPVFLNKTKNV